MPIHSDAGQPTSRFQGGRIMRSAIGCATSETRPSAISPSASPRAGAP